MSTRLVAERALREGWSSRSWRAVTVIMLLLGIAAVIVPRLIDLGAPTYTLATVEPPSAALTATLDAAEDAGDFEVELVAVADAEAAYDAVRDGDADVALVGAGGDATLYVDATGAGPLPTIVSQALVAEAITAELAAAGLSPAEIAEIQQVPAPNLVEVGPVSDSARGGIGFVISIVVYLALILTGSSIATAVATEKSTRVSEVLLTVLRPSQLLNGTVAGVGLLGLIQVAALAVPVAVGLTVGGTLDIPAEATGDVLLGIVWFGLGMLLYAFVFAALASLVEKVSEVGSAIVPVNVLLIGSYLVAIIATTDDPDGTLSVFSSLFPFSAPLVMPVRWAAGVVPPWQLVLSMVLVVLTAAALARFAAAVYSRGIVTTGRRVRLRDVRAVRPE